MGWIRNLILKYLKIEDTIKMNVRKEIRGEKMSLGINGTDMEQKYFQMLNYALFTADPAKIEEFYKERVRPGMMYEQQSFWSKVTNDVVKIHYPLPAAISRSMAHILFGEPIKFRVDTGNKEKNKKLNDRLESIYKENNLNELLQKGAMMESYSGSLGAPIVIDSDFTDHPIIQWYPAEQIDLNTKYGRIYEVIFNDEKEYDNRRYTFRTICGFGYITYELLDEKGNQVPLATIPDLADIKDVAILGPDKKPLKILLGVFKPNKTGSTQSIDSLYGASDYEGIYGISDALDEIISAWSDTYRNSRIITFMSEDAMARDPKTGVLKIPNKFGINTLTLYDGDATNTEVKVIRDIPAVTVQHFKEGFEQYIKAALQKVELSPITMGILDSISRLSSSESLAEREKVTLKTRQVKIKLWQEYLAKLSRLLLIFDDIKDMSPIEKDGVLVYEIDETYDYDYLIEFPQYVFPSKQEQLRNAAFALNNRLVDHETILRSLYEDEYDEEYILAMKDKIIEESGQSKATTKTVSDNGKTEEPSEENLEE